MNISDWSVRSTHHTLVSKLLLSHPKCSMSDQFQMRTATHRIKIYKVFLWDWLQSLRYQIVKRPTRNRWKTRKNIFYSFLIVNKSRGICSYMMSSHMYRRAGERSKWSCSSEVLEKSWRENKNTEIYSSFNQFRRDLIGNSDSFFGWKWLK